MLSTVITSAKEEHDFDKERIFSCQNLPSSKFLGFTMDFQNGLIPKVLQWDSMMGCILGWLVQKNQHVLRSSL